MKKTLTLMLTVGALALTSMTVFAVDQTPVSIGEDLEIIVPSQESIEKAENELALRPCGLEDCGYGTCENTEDCPNDGPRRDGSGEGRGMMRGLRNGQGKGGRGNCCK